MKALRIVFAAAFLTGAASEVVAHPGHGKELSAEAVTKRAASEVDRLVEEGKIEKSWALKRSAGMASKRGVDDDEQWVVTFENSAAAEDSKRKLYVFLTPSGDYVAANFSGK